MAAYCIDLMSFLDEENEPIAWLVDGLIPRQGLAVLAGAPKSAKTYLAQDLSLAVATGQEFLGRACARGPVLYVLEEGVRAGTAERFRKLTARRGPSADVHLILRQGVRLDDDDALARLKEAIALIHPILIILDPMIRLHGAQEDRSWQMQPVMTGIQRIIDVHQTTVLLVHHTAKHAEVGSSASVAARGSGVVTSSTDVNLILHRKGSRGRLTCEVRDAEDAIVEFEFDGTAGGFSVIAGSSPHIEPRLPGGIVEADLRALALRAITDDPTSGLSTRELAAARGWSDETARRALVAAAASGVLRRVGPANAPRYRPGEV